MTGRCLDEDNLSSLYGMHVAKECVNYRLTRLSMFFVSLIIILYVRNCLAIMCECMSAYLHILCSNMNTIVTVMYFTVLEY